MKTYGNGAPELQISKWFNTDEAITLAGLRGKVVVLVAFQMLCPGCVAIGLPQAIKIRKTFAETDVAVLGIHTVFEHHSVMGPEALKVFLFEYRIDFPVGVDVAAANSETPLTMQAYSMRGTPSLIIIDQSGTVRSHHFAHVDDLSIGAEIGLLLGSSRAVSGVPMEKQTRSREASAAGCDDISCSI